MSIFKSFIFRKVILVLFFGSWIFSLSTSVWAQGPLECEDDDFYCRSLETALTASECPLASSRYRKICRGLQAAILNESCERSGYLQRIFLGDQRKTCFSIVKGYVQGERVCHKGEVDCFFGAYVKRYYLGAFEELRSLKTKMHLFRDRFTLYADNRCFFGESVLYPEQFSRVTRLARKILKHQEFETKPERDRFLNGLAGTLARGVLSPQELILWNNLSLGTQKSIRYYVDSHTGELFVKGLIRSDQPEAFESMKQEKDLLSRFGGQGFAKAVHFDSSCSSPQILCLQYYPFDLLDGTTRGDFKRSFLGPFRQDQILYRITGQLLRTLQTAHRQGIYHLDIKLENILYDWETAKVYLIDLGVSHELSLQTRALRFRSRGSAAYKPPFLAELPVGQTWESMELYLPRIDLFALGLTLELMARSEVWQKKAKQEKGLFHLIYQVEGLTSFITHERKTVKNVSSLHRVYQTSFETEPPVGTLDRVIYELLKSGVEPVRLEDVIALYNQVEPPRLVPKFGTLSRE